MLSVEKRTRMVMGGKNQWTPASGYMLIDVGIKVVNLSASSIDVKWNEVYLMNSDNEWWPAYYGKFEEGSRNFADPFKTGLSDTALEPENTFTVKHNGVLRVVFHIPKEATCYFGFADSPLTEVDIK